MIKDEARLTGFAVPLMTSWLVHVTFLVRKEEGILNFWHTYITE